MSLSRETLEGIAHLARLSLSEDDIKTASKDLNNILDLVGQIAKADTQGVMPLSSPVQFSQPLREDIVNATDERTKLMANAPEQQDGAFLVPRVIE